MSFFNFYFSSVGGSQNSISKREKFFCQSKKIFHWRRNHQRFTETTASFLNKRHWEIKLSKLWHDKNSKKVTNSLNDTPNKTELCVLTSKFWFNWTWHNEQNATNILNVIIITINRLVTFCKIKNVIPWRKYHQWFIKTTMSIINKWQAVQGTTCKKLLKGQRQFEQYHIVVSSNVCY